MQKIILCLIIVFLINNYHLFSRDFRVNQLPNGSKFRCSNCHNNPNGGGALNKFGQTVGSQYLSSGNVVWNASLAALDSDGDGFTNGSELGDPNGDWKVGLPNPNNSSITNPGDAASIPSSVLESLSDNNNSIKILNISPNTIKNNSTIKYQINKPSLININIYNSNGILIDELVSSFHNPGDYFYNLNLNELSLGLSQGMYWITLSNENSMISSKVFIIK